MMTNEKKYPFYYYIITLALPVVFFVVLELGLRLFGYGQTIPQWIHPSDHFSDYIVLNQDITKKYFHNIKARPSPTYDGFFETKKPGTFRVFVMGGSTTAGFPFTINGSFARYIRHFMETAYPRQNIEVINLGISAVNSYTIRDLIPGVIEKEPDLLIFYMGHNEYYGAYGVGSAEYLGTVRWLVNLMIDLEDYRTIQLLRNIISGFIGKDSETSPSQKQETLMSRMVGEKLIPFDSEVYHKGLSQFEGNYSDILEMLQNHQIPVILSRLTANIKDQPPFESVPMADQISAETVFEQARLKYSQLDSVKAKTLFLRAKDLDALRFRGPEALNMIIDSLGRKFKLPVVPMDSVFNDISPQSIPGNNLFIDHVHPTLAGYRQMGAAFAEMMIKTGNLPKFPAQVTINAAHRTAAKRMTLTYLDSSAAELRIRNLKGGWPFLKENIQNVALRNYQPANHIQSLALGMVLKKLNWEEAHVQAALWYRNNGHADSFLLEMRAILENIPLNAQPFKLLIDGMIQFQRIDDAYPYLLELDERLPDAYSKKWLGIYYLYKKSYQKALAYLLQSEKLNDQDPQLLYNLAGAHLHNQQHQEALQAIQKCLTRDKNFPGAQRMEKDLLRLME